VVIDRSRNIENQWRRDRQRLVVCRDRHGNLVRYYEETNRILK